MQFYNSEYLPIFWVLPLLAATFLAAARIRKGRMARFGDLKTVERMSHFSIQNLRGKAFVLSITMALAFFALLRPQWGAEKKQLERKGVDILFLVDTSLSMLAADVKPSRIEKVKLEIRSFVKKLKGDRIGLLPFAGSSFLQSPLTLDSAAFFLFLDALNVGYIPDPGSSLRDALENAVRAFPKEEKKYRVAVLFSDGEFHGENLDAVLAKTAKEGVKIYTVGMGTKEGEPIPLKAEKGKVVGYKKDREGQVIITRLQEDILRQVAEKTGGLYFPSTAGEREIDLIYQDIQKIGKKEFKKKLVVEREDHYQLFLFLAWILLMLDSFLGDRRRKARMEGVLG